MFRRTRALRLTWNDSLFDRPSLPEETLLPNSKRPELEEIRGNMLRLAEAAD